MRTSSHPAKRGHCDYGARPGTPAERLFRCAIIETWNDWSEPGVALSR